MAPFAARPHSLDEQHGITDVVEQLADGCAGQPWAGEAQHQECSFIRLDGLKQVVQLGQRKGSPTHLN